MRERRIALALAAVVATVLSFRIPAVPDSELDGSWRYVLSAASAQHLVFGRDLVYTYGPLGWLSAPVQSPYHQPTLLLLLGVLAIGCGAAITLLVAHTLRRQRAAVVYTLAVGAFAWRGTTWTQALPPDYQLIFVAVVALVCADAQSPRARLAYAAVGMCAGLALAMKIFAALTIALVCGVSLCATVRAHRRAAVRLATLALAAFLVTSAVTLFDPIRHGVLADYLRDSFDLANGYAAAMGSAGTVAEGRAALAAFVLGLAIAGWCALQRGVRVAAMCSIVLVLAWKHATIRAGLDHAVYLYATLAFVMAIVIAMSSTRKLAVAAASVGIAALVHLGTLDVVNHATLPPSIADGTLVAPPALWRNRTIDALPNDALTALVSGGRYQPLPMFQLFSAFTPRIDRRDADALRAHGADVVLYRYTSIDNRYPFADGPLVIRGLLCGYDAFGTARTADGRTFAELRRTHDRCRSIAETHITRLRDPIGLPPLEADELIFARITFESTTLGRMRSLVSRVAPPTLAFTYVNGMERDRAFVAATAADGIAIDPAPTGQVEARAMFAGQLRGNVKSITIVPGPDYRVLAVTLVRERRRNEAPRLARRMFGLTEDNFRYGRVR